MLKLSNSCRFYLTTVILLCVPYLGRTQSTVSPNEQLTNNDLSKIIALLGQQPQSSSDSKQTADSIAAASSQAPSLSAPNSLQSPPTQDEVTQSLALLNALLGSNGGVSPETSSLAGLNVAPQQSKNANAKGDEAAQTMALLNSLLGSAGGNSGASSSDAASLAALLSLASAAASSPAATQTQQSTQEQSAADAQNAALLTNLLLSATAGNQNQGATTAGNQAKVKQQDFQNFQNAGQSLDSSSSNQLNGILGLLGTLGSLGGASAQPSLFNLGGQQQQQSNILGSLLGGGGGGGAGGLASLLSGVASQQQRPGLLSSLGGLASVVGSTLSGSRGDGKPRVRGVDTRLGVGYRFGENADAQVVWEIGPQLFTEPLTNEQKQILLQQQQQLQRRQLLQNNKQNANRRMHVSRKPTNNIPTLQSINSPQKQKINSNNLPIARRQLISASSSPLSKMTKPSSTFTVPSQMSSTSLKNGAWLRSPNPTQTSLKTLVQQLESQSLENKKLNFYAKKEANPRTNKHVQLTEYERWLLINPKRNQNQIGQQSQNQPLVLSASSILNQQNNKKDVFVFTKDNAKNIVRVRLQPRESFRQVKSPAAFSSRMGNSYDFYNPAADDSYLRRNAMVVDPRVREFEREQERQQHILNMQRRQPYNSFNGGVSSSGGKKLQANRRISPGMISTLADWNEKSGVLDYMQNYMLNGLQAEGNHFVKNFYRAKEQEQKRLNLPVSPAQQLSATIGSGLIPSIKGLLGIDKSQQAALQPSTEAPIVKVGQHVKYEDLKLMLNGGQELDENSPLPSGSSSSGAFLPPHQSGPFPTPASEIFIDIENGEVSMRKPFGTMESFTPPPPELVSEDSPKHVFKVLQQQLAEQYEKVKIEQLKEAAKQRRKEAIAQGLNDPQDPLYLVSKYFELVEKEDE